MTRFHFLSGRLVRIPVAIIFLASTSVPSLYRMYCPMKGRVMLSWAGPARCCHVDERPEYPAFMVHCCDLSSMAAERPGFSRSEELVLLKVLVEMLMPSCHGLLDASGPEGIREVRPDGHSPPPGRTADRLARLGVFLI